MRVLVDTNRLIAALVKQGTTREILFDKHFEFVTPDHTIAEINEHKEEIQRRVQLTDKEFETLLALIFERVTIIPYEEYGSFMSEARKDISDPDDVPHLAACYASHAECIWAHDTHFLEQNKVKVFTNIDMLRISGKSNVN